MHGSATHYSGLRFVPSATLVAVVTVVGFVLFTTGETTRVAVGFLVPLIVLGLVDAALGARTITSRPLLVNPVRRFVDWPTPVTFAASGGGAGNVAIAIGAWTTDATRRAPVVIPNDGTMVLVSAPEDSPRASYVFRFEVSSSHLGLIRTRRWEAHRAPEGLFWAPGRPDVLATTAIGTLGQGLLREYVPGDRMAQVSWPTTAKTGRLHVRSQGVGDDEVVVVVDLGLPKSVDDVDRVMTLRLATDVIGSILLGGSAVRLLTREMIDAYYDREADAACSKPHRVPHLSLRAGDDGFWYDRNGPTNHRVVDAIVRDDMELIRRLALARQGPPIDPPTTRHIHVTPDHTESRQ